MMPQLILMLALATTAAILVSLMVRHDPRSEKSIGVDMTGWEKFIRQDIARARTERHIAISENLIRAFHDLFLNDTEDEAAFASAIDRLYTALEKQRKIVAHEKGRMKIGPGGAIALMLLCSPLTAHRLPITDNRSPLTVYRSPAADTIYVKKVRIGNKSVWTGGYIIRKSDSIYQIKGKDFKLKLYKPTKNRRYAKQ